LDWKESSGKQAVGPMGPLLAIEIGLTMKLHAVATGGPPEGQCKRSRPGLLLDISQLLPYSETERDAPHSSCVESTLLSSNMLNGQCISRMNATR
jgi:hypothetical protein